MRLKSVGTDCLYAETDSRHSFSLSPTDNENHAIRWNSEID